MGIKKRSKVSAEFSMSSLTDIIFLLLIFFMLTSSLVAPNALNLKLPGSSNTPTSAPREISDVRISRGGNFYFDNKRVSLNELQTDLRNLARQSSKPAVTISPDPGTPTEHVVAVMDLAMRFNINGVLTTDEE